MAIGTSLGAFFLDDMKFHSGVEEVIKPPKGDADMEVPPKTLEDRKTYEPPVIQVSNVLVPPNKMGITDEDVDKAVDIGLAFSGGGLSTIRRGAQMRKGANDNHVNKPGDEPFPWYNPREPNMIGSREVDDAIDRSWRQQVERHRRGVEIQHEKTRINSAKTERQLSEIENARIGKLEEEYTKLFPDN